MKLKTLRDIFKRKKKTETPIMKAWKEGYQEGQKKQTEMIKWQLIDIIKSLISSLNITEENLK